MCEHTHTTSRKINEKQELRIYVHVENPCHYYFPQMLAFTERTMKQEKGELTNCQTIKELCLEQGITKH